tara:strand:+ start:3400 stop:3627 length:228 start_codon:yes stop_codon:yes gene_type:complete
MKKLLIITLLTGFAMNAQEVDILDKNRKVIKTVQEKHLKRTVDSIGEKAQYTARWVNYTLKEKCIKWNELENIFI